MNEPLIEFRGVKLSYGAKTVLSDLNFSINGDDFVGIIGANGSGKTTILKAILGLVRPSGGSISARRGVVYGYVPQSNTMDRVFPFTVFDVVKMGMYGRLSVMKRFNKAHAGKVVSVLSQAGIERYRNVAYRDLSGGLKQRALIARALVNDPDVLVLDEPTNDLDIAGEKSIMDLVENLHRTRRVAVIMVSHLVNVVINYVKKIGFIDAGKFGFHAIGDALNETELWQTYHSKLRIATVFGKKVIMPE